MLFLGKSFRELGETSLDQFRRWNETQRGRINAIAQTRWSWTIIEDVTEMGIGFGRTHFLAIHSGGSVGEFLENIPRNRLGKTRPTGAGVEFVERTKERLAADHRNIDASLVIVEVFVVKRRLGPAFHGHVILQRSELFLQSLFLWGISTLRGSAGNKSER